ncbi:MAG TPA: hypothetical protein VFV38_46195, partial [Ktedonobacteraceae bacterium]|nr:hypothetical protein [Ktedonobacteraceae bacterium]
MNLTSALHSCQSESARALTWQEPSSPGLASACRKGFTAFRSLQLTCVAGTTDLSSEVGTAVIRAVAIMRLHHKLPQTQGFFKVPKRRQKELILARIGKQSTSYESENELKMNLTIFASVPQSGT